MMYDLCGMLKVSPDMDGMGHETSCTEPAHYWWKNSNLSLCLGCYNDMVNEEVFTTRDKVVPIIRYAFKTRKG